MGAGVAVTGSPQITASKLLCIIGSVVRGREKSSGPLSTTSAIQATLGLNLDHCGEKFVIDYMSCGMAKAVCKKGECCGQNSRLCD